MHVTRARSDSTVRVCLPGTRRVNLAAFMSNELSEILQIAIHIAHGAGAILREGLQHVAEASAVARIAYKSAETDPVTEYDHRSEAYIVEQLTKHFPAHHIVGEEGGAYAANSHSAFEWHVDPLDGTVNFAHGFPVFAVSLGLLIDGVPSVGVVYNPVTEETFTATRGGGAALNGRPIQVSATAVLSRALLNTGFPYDRRTSPENNFEPFLAFQRASQEVRRVGSAALDCCTVACGRMDGYWELKIRSWDIAAGLLIVQEAGGRVTDFDGATDMLSKRRIVASNGRIHDEMLSLLQATLSAAHDSHQPSLSSIP